MDPFSRKLFRNSDARQRLAQMGGIVASSPELASTVQRFQDGSLVSAEPEYVVIIPGVTDRRGMRVNARTLEELSRANPELLQQSQVFDAEVARQQGIDVGRLQPGDAILRNRLLGPQAPQPSTPSQTELGRLTSFLGLGQDIPDITQDYDWQGPDAGLPFATASVEAPTTPAEAIGLDVEVPPPVAAEAPGPLGGSVIERELEQIRQQNQRVFSGVRDFFGGLPETLSAPDPSMTPEELALREELMNEAAALEMTQGTPLEYDDIGEIMPPPPSVEAPAPSVEAPPPGGTGDQDPLAQIGSQLEQGLRTFFGIERPSREPGSRREVFNQELDLVREVYGDRTRDQARDRAMHLAMIGLAIAAGQSPNAITNIAQGALAGTQAMARAQQAQQEREDQMRLQAYQAMVGAEREDRNFERQARLALGTEQLRAMRGAEGESSRQEYLFNDLVRSGTEYYMKEEGLSFEVAVQRASVDAARSTPGAPSAQRILRAQGASPSAPPNGASTQVDPTTAVLGNPAVDSQGQSIPAGARVQTPDGRRLVVRDGRWASDS